jgi:NADH dehydrogenase
MQKIVIVGGGFAGADLARRLHRSLPNGWEVRLYSRENHFVFTPLLPEVVGASINPLHVVWPVREMAQGVTCRTAEVRSLDIEQKEIEYIGPDGEALRERYDHLVICCGLAANRDIVPGMLEHGWALKSMGDAFALRNHAIQQLERAEVEPDDQRRRQLLSFAVVGGGFTGVEVAGALRDMLFESARYYQRFAVEDIQVTILDGGPRILGPLPEALSAYAAEQLQAMGVAVRCSVSCESVTSEGVVLAGGETLVAGTVIGTVGNTIQPLLANAGLAMERGRVVVRPDMRVEGRDDVWALGDCAAVPNAYDSRISPTLGQFATRQSKQLARNLLAILGGRGTEAFHYHTRGMFAALGHGRAVGNPFGIRVSGFLAYMMWRGIYLSKMPSFGRQLQIAFDWFWALFFRRDIVELSTLQSPSEAVPESHRATGD